MNKRSSARARSPEPDLYRCQESIGYLFRRDGLLRKALTHSSVKDEKHPSNERLEFLGDAILGMVISEYLFSLLPGNDEGDLTKVKSVVVSSQTLARLGLELGLDRFLLVGRGIRLKSEVPRSLVANSVEAIIAAVYLDRGMEAARHFVLDHLHRYVEEVLADDHAEKNYKSLLQQYAQKELSGTPTYRVLSETGPDHSKRFRVAAVISRREFPPGLGSSKKEAEQDAARTALKALREGKRPRKKAAGKKNGKKKTRARAARAEKKSEPGAEERRKAGSGRRSAKKAEPSDAPSGRTSSRRKAKKSAKKAAAKRPAARRAKKPDAEAKPSGRKADGKKPRAKKAASKKPTARKGRRRPRSSSANGE